MVVSDLILPFLLIGFAALVWKHANISRRALNIALQHTKRHQVSLLDQSVVLKKMRLVRSKSSLLAVQREYQFEFSSIGDARYKGMVVFNGAKVMDVSMQAFKTAHIEEE